MLVRTIDNYAPMPTYDVHCSVAGLPDGVHVLRIVVLGEGRPADDPLPGTPELLRPGPKQVPWRGLARGLKDEG